MPEDPKTIAIDTSEVLARQRASGKGDDDIPRTIAVDQETLARRMQSAREETANTPRAAGGARRWMLVLAAAVVAVLVYALVS